MESVAELLRLHEGYRRHPYQCTAGKTTVGIGRNLDDVGIDEDEASYLLSRDIERAIKSLRFEPYWLDLDAVRQAVLIDMTVNLGWPRFQGFRMLRDALGRGDYAEACRQMVNSHWYSQVGDRAKRLVGMMQHGVWLILATALVIERHRQRKRKESRDA